ncbi:hypothetical protein [Halolamina salina]|uniref:Uncharacterized protein n=1 Tax=Halolamina salina TaxID=1220023 RepID=A0ABD6B907_9EURY
MNSRRAVSVLLAAVAATMLVTGSFGFTSVSAERGVAVNVVESENAYVNVSACEKSNGNATSRPARVTVTNQFSGSFTIEDVSWGDLNRERTLQPGESTTFNNAFADAADGTVTVDVTGGLDATVTAQVSEKADCPKNPKKGGGNADKGGRESGDTQGETE